MKVTLETKCPWCGNMIKPVVVLYGTKAFTKCRKCGEYVDQKVIEVKP